MLMSSLMSQGLKRSACIQTLSPFCLLINKCGWSIAVSECSLLCGRCHISHILRFGCQSQVQVTYSACVRCILGAVQSHMIISQNGMRKRQATHKEGWYLLVIFHKALCGYIWVNTLPLSPLRIGRKSNIQR